MTRRLLILLVGTGLTSLANLWLYIVVAASDSSGQFALFVKANYLGGLYLAGIAGSANVVAMYAFRSGSAKSVLWRYVILSGAVAIPLLVGGLFTGNPLGASLCILSAICMQIAGLMIAALIEADRPVLVFFLTPLHPIMFLIALEWLPEELSMRWVWCYFLASVLLCLKFVLAGWGHLSSSLQEQMTCIETSTKDVMARMLLATSFSVALQLDLIIAGTLRHLNVADFAIMQKIYGSVATAVNGSTVQALLVRTKNSLNVLTGAWMLGLSFASGLGAFVILEAMIWLQPTFSMHSMDIFLTAVAGSLYYLSTFSNTWAIVKWPRTSGLGLIVGAMAYAIAIELELIIGVKRYMTLPIVAFFLCYCMIVLLRGWKEARQ